MAIITTDSVCAICREPLRGEPIFATSGVFLPPGDRGFAMCDAPMHWRCYAPWPERPRFARAYFEARRGVGAPYWGTVHEDEELRVRVNPNRPHARVDVMLAATGSGWFVELGDWDEWVTRAPAAAHTVEDAALRSVWPRILALGDRERLVARVSLMVPPEAKRISDHYTAKTAWSRLLHGDVPCPACGSRETEARFVDELATGGTSSCACGACGHRLTPDEIFSAAEVVLPVTPLGPPRRRLRG
jgi:hypothetical protein